eukprot:TRINITY_DN5149_c3_g1_i1.p1 TRINITY_DN5149_c3_g1~~TRINITY_DN5149_c3_g1_i1.p1  ORF type:complete len:194 (+),score=24.42 TRINITY_DN5149_c3_g1_i1:56-637(+)
MSKSEAEREKQFKKMLRDIDAELEGQVNVGVPKMVLYLSLALLGIIGVGMCGVWWVVSEIKSESYIPSAVEICNMTATELVVEAGEVTQQEYIADKSCHIVTFVGSATVSFPSVSAIPTILFGPNVTIQAESSPYLSITMTHSTPWSELYEHLPLLGAASFTAAVIAASMDSKAKRKYGMMGNGLPKVPVGRI